jgi:hypothetical protein
MSVPDPQHVLSLAAEMVKTKERLATLQAEWDSLFTNSTPEVTRPGKRPADADALTTRIVALLESTPSEHFSIGDLTRDFGVEKVQIERAVNRLYSTGKIARHSRGMYGAKQETFSA